MQPLRQCSCDLRGGNNGTERSTVPNSLGHRHDVRHHILNSNPQMRAGAPESRLHLIANTRRPFGALNRADRHTDCLPVAGNAPEFPMQC
jgi:hypothetical protein